MFNRILSMTRPCIFIAHITTLNTLPSMKNTTSLTSATFSDNICKTSGVLFTESPYTIHRAVHMSRESAALLTSKKFSNTIPI